MRLSRRFFIPLLVLVVAGAVGVVLLKTGPTAKRKQSSPVKIVVDTLAVKPDSFAVFVSSQGVMAPSVRTALTSEAAGRLVEVSPNFVRGAYFEKGELLARIDPESYRLKVANLEASLKVVAARVEELETVAKNQKKSLVIESQNLNLSKRQFERLRILKKSGTVTESALESGERELLSRRSSLLNLQNAMDLIPAQLNNLKAEQQLKQAEMDAAILDLDRTAILAPFTGRVLDKQAELGQFVTKGQTLGEIYALGKWEVRLPVSNRELALLDIGDLKNGVGPKVELTSSSDGDANRSWNGEIVRIESAVDPNTRQVILVANINVDTNVTDEKPDIDLLDGRYVKASISGKTLNGVFILPRHTVGPGDRLLVITPENRLERRLVDIIWRDEKSVVLKDGLNPGEYISLTPLPYAPEGVLLTIAKKKSSVDTTDQKNSMHNQVK
ncbi:MAG: HlyD family efflux transporter periplasmic adaptor subunit [Magnetococcales bacterium]|nr:HlyD family efflux transporter periplasmic adaptor subunit [Magnetococcales bacterium]